MLVGEAPLGSPLVPPAAASTSVAKDKWEPITLPLSYANQAGAPYVDLGVGLQMKGGVGKDKIPCDSRAHICYDKLGVRAGSMVGGPGGNRKVKWKAAGMVSREKSGTNGEKKFGHDWFLVLCNTEDTEETFLCPPGSTIAVLRQDESELTLPPGCHVGVRPDDLIAKRNKNFWYQGVSDFSCYAHVGKGGQWASPSVLGAACDAPGPCLCATFCPCAAVYHQRKSLLLDDLEGNYRCYGGIDHRIGWCCISDACVVKHPQGCLLVESIFCTTCALEGNRTMVKQHYGLPHDCCESCIIKPCVDPIAGGIDSCLSCLSVSAADDEAGDDCSMCQESAFNIMTWSYYAMCFGCLHAQLSHQTQISAFGTRHRDSITTATGGGGDDRAYPQVNPINKYGARTPTSADIAEFKAEVFKKLTDPRRILSSAMS